MLATNTMFLNRPSGSTTQQTHNKFISIISFADYLVAGSYIYIAAASIHTTWGLKANFAITMYIKAPHTDENTDMQATKLHMLIAIHR